MGRGVCWLLVLLLHLAAALVPCVNGQLPSTSVVGEAGHYAGPTDVDPNHPPGAPIIGACGYGELQVPAFLARAALHKTAAAAALKCAAPLRFPVFQQNLTNDTPNGVVPISFRQVACTPPGNIVVDVRQVRPSQGGFLQLTIEQVQGPGGLSNVSIRSAGQGAFSPLQNSFGAVWQSTGRLPPAPFDLQVTSGIGQPLLLPSVIPRLAAGRYPTSVQFSTTGAALPVSTPAPVAPAALPAAKAPPPATAAPIAVPTAAPTAVPTAAPLPPPKTVGPTAAPTALPTATPTAAPLPPPKTAAPTAAPMALPTAAPTAPALPAAGPLGAALLATPRPTLGAYTAPPKTPPTAAALPALIGAPPILPTAAPLPAPTAAPTPKPTVASTLKPTVAPSKAPSTNLSPGQLIAAIISALGKNSSAPTPASG